MRVPVAMLERATAVIDSLDGVIAVRDSMLDAQRDYYVRLLEIKDTQDETLRDALRDAQDAADRTIVDRILDGLIGYGLRAATE